MPEHDVAAQETTLGRADWSRNRVTRSFLLRFFALAATLFLLGFAALVHHYFAPGAERTAFNRDAWLAVRHLEGVGDPGCYRGGMALDLVKSGQLIGKGLAEVEATLGAPTSRTPTSWRYALGQCTGFGWEHSLLVVRFGSSPSVTEAHIRRAWDETL
ncbi:MAG: hypothetical protein ACK5TK_00080 [Betaproteobacteria bacterium]